MAIVLCSKGHYYDDGKFFQCPYCGVTFDFTDQTQYGTDQDNTHIIFENDDDRTELLTGAGDDRTELLTGSYDDRTELLFGADDDRTLILNSERSSSIVPSSSQERKKGNVTGWLVCIDGAGRGQDYRLHEGYNRIGRNAQMDVYIQNDFHILADTHCMIEYDVKKNMFTIIPSEISKTYLNNRELKGNKKISNGDKIVIGESTFEFVAFCHGRKKW